VAEPDVEPAKRAADERGYTQMVRNQMKPQLPPILQTAKTHKGNAGAHKTIQEKD
jgi:hypothetical protein